MLAWITSLLRELVPVPIVPSRSSTTTSRPASAKARATARPTTPAPITTVSTCSADTMRPILNEGLLERMRYSEPDDGESADTRTAARRGLAGDRAGRSRRGGDDRPGADAGERRGFRRLHRAQPSRRRADAAGAARGGAAGPGGRPRARSALRRNPPQPGKRA